MVKRFSLIAGVSVLGLALVSYHFWYRDKPEQASVSEQSEHVATPSQSGQSVHSSQAGLSDKSETPSLQADQNPALGDDSLSDTTANQAGPLDNKKQTASKRDQLVDLNLEIDQQNADLEDLIKEYDEDLTNQDNKNELSVALKNSDAYKANLLEKFKIEADGVGAKN